MNFPENPLTRRQFLVGAGELAAGLLLAKNQQFALQEPGLSVNVWGNSLPTSGNIQIDLPGGFNGLPLPFDAEFEEPEFDFKTSIGFERLVPGHGDYSPVILECLLGRFSEEHYFASFNLTSKPNPNLAEVIQVHASWINLRIRQVSINGTMVPIQRSTI